MITLNNWLRLCGRLTVASLALAIVCPQAAEASTPDEAFRPCIDEDCGMPSEKSFHHFVIGRIATVVTAADAVMEFDRMRQARHWQAVPADSQAFFGAIQPIVIDTGKRRFLLNTSQAEMHAVPLGIGDLVRYSPHIGDYERPPADPAEAAYFNIDGCIAILCRASDEACAARYVTGVFATDTGEQLDVRTRKPMAAGTVIETTSMLPKNVR